MDTQNCVTLFGSARLTPSSPEYVAVQQIASLLGKNGFKIITAGGPGLMTAARLDSSGPPAEGTENKSPPHIYRDYRLCNTSHIHFANLVPRMEDCLNRSDAIVVAAGGLGTLLELFYCLQYVQLRGICEIPIVLFGEIWKGLVDWLCEEILTRQFFDVGEVSSLFHISTPDNLSGLLTRIHLDRKSASHVCVFYPEYRLTFGDLITPFAHQKIASGPTFEKPCTSGVSSDCPADIPPQSGPAESLTSKSIPRDPAGV